MTQKANTATQTINSEQMMISTQLFRDFKNAILIVSLVVNLTVLTAWIAVMVTSQYDAQVASLLF